MSTEYFNSNIGELPEPKERYVCWMDVMGTSAISSRSITEAAIKVFKLHISAVANFEDLPEWCRNRLEMYPMMDGVYAVSESKEALQRLLESIFVSLGEDMVDAEEIHHVLAIRAAIAYGPIIEGNHVNGYNDILEGTDHQQRTMVGLPIVQSFLSEGKAPPFGVFIHESARAFAPDREDPFQFVWWKWFRSNHDEYNYEELALDIRQRLGEYYRWGRQNSKRIGYSEDKIDEHERLAEQYLPNVEEE